MTWLSDGAIRRLQQVATWPDLGGLRYVALRELGRGGMGTVYRAHDEELDRDVALKVINAAGPHDALGARLRREARILARLEHPGIVPIHDAGVLPDGRAFYVMKLVEGELLPDHLARLDTLDARLRLFERICEPVAFAHARGIVHRDLKPANVMIGAFGEVLVMDWGVARSIGAGEEEEAAAEGEEKGEEKEKGEEDEEERTRAVPQDRAGPPAPMTAAGFVIGTPGFMPPEQVRSPALVDARADVFALGGILFTILTGEAPPESGEAAARLESRRDAPPRLRAICRKAMAESPDERYSGAGALAEDVGRFLAGLPVRAYRESLLERAWRMAVKYRTPLLLITAYLIMRALVAWYMT